MSTLSAKRKAMRGTKRQCPRAKSAFTTSLAVQSCARHAGHTIRPHLNQCPSKGPRCSIRQQDRMAHAAIQATPAVAAGCRAEFRDPSETVAAEVEADEDLRNPLSEDAVALIKTTRRRTPPS